MNVQVNDKKISFCHFFVLFWKNFVPKWSSICLELKHKDSSRHPKNLISYKNISMSVIFVKQRMEPENKIRV